ncbi:DMT family transporter [Palleronia rufa]|uniref:DMT family transporter n=1 Tax=Palleronia rufa TaxID=1530186 RepID=UPI002E165228
MIAPWIAVTLIAALAQTFRFLLQRHLKRTRLSTAGATFSRFLFSAPLVALLLLAGAAFTGTALPEPSPAFWRFVLSGGVAQILATACVIALFGLRNFAVGITFKKSETILTAIVGFVLLGEVVSAGAAGAIALGVIAVIVLSGEAGRWNPRAVALGLGSGALFAVSAVCFRGAALSLGDAPVLIRSGSTLAVATLWQTLILGAWLIWREPGQLAAVARAWRIAGLAGLFSMVGSMGWFTAFALQNAAYVKALGQVEVVFSILATTLFLGETISRREVLGIGLLTLSIVALILAV